MGADPQILIVDPVLLGRAGPMGNVKSEQMFCALTTDVTDPTTVNTFSELTSGWTTGQPSSQPTAMFQSCSRLWLVSLRGTDVYRTSPDPISPLTRQVLDNGPLPAGAIRSDNVHAYRAAVKCSSESGFAVFEIDLNQELELWAHRVEVALLGPTNGVSIPSNFPPGSVTRTGFVVDSVVGCQIVPIESSKSCKEAHLTQFVRIAAAQQITIPVPRGAVLLKVYQGAPLVAPATVMWTRQLAAAPALPVIVGTISFANRESIDASAPVGAESHLLTDIDPANARLFVLRWTIRP